MKLHILHDDEGNILSLSMLASEGQSRQMRLKLKQDQHACVVDVPDEGQSHWHLKFREIAHRNWIDLSSGTPKLVQKTKLKARDRNP